MKKMKKFSYALLGVGVFFAFFALKASPTLADGMAIHHTTEPNKVFDYTNERSQQAFINYNSGVEKMILSVDLDTTSAEGDTLWIFPIPAKPTDISIDVIKELPQLNGEEISSKAKSRLTEIQSKLWQTQIYPYFFTQPQHLDSRYPTSQGKGLVTNSLSTGSASNSQDVVVYDTLQKEGITSELATAQTASGLYDHLKEKGLNIEPGSIPIFDEYIEKDFSFILSWISNKQELIQNQSGIGLADMNSPDPTLPNFEPPDVPTEIPTVEPSVDIKQKRLAAIEKILDEYGQKSQDYKQLDDILANVEKKHPDLKSLKEDRQIIRRAVDDMAALELPEMTGIIANLEKKHPQLQKSLAAGFPENANVWGDDSLFNDLVGEVRNNPKVFDKIKEKDKWQYQYVGGPPPYKPDPSDYVNAKTLVQYLAENPSLKKDLINEINDSPVSDSLSLPVEVKPSPPTPIYQNQDNRFPNYPSNPTQKRGVSITFPTDKIFFPLKPTSVYGDKVIPIDVRIMGYVKPDLPDNIKNNSSITYYTNNKAGYTAETKNFFGEKVPDNYTKININQPAKYLQDDLRISNFPPFKAYLTLFVAQYPAILTILLLIFSSLIAGFFASVFTLKNWITKSSIYKIFILGLSNCLTIIGVIIAVIIYSYLNKKAGQQVNAPQANAIGNEDEELLNKIKAKGYPVWLIAAMGKWKNFTSGSKNMHLIVYAVLFSIFFLIISLFAVKMLSYFLLGDASGSQYDGNILVSLERFFQGIFSFSD